MKLNRVARIGIPLVVLTATAWAIGGRGEELAFVVILAVTLAIMLPLIAHYKRPVLDSAQESVGQVLEALAAFCSPRAILRSVSVWQALARATLLVLFLPTLLLMPVLRRVTR